LKKWNLQKLSLGSSTLKDTAQKEFEVLFVADPIAEHVNTVYAVNTEQVA